jgi:hypothetical protein
MEKQTNNTFAKGGVLNGVDKINYTKSPITLAPVAKQQKKEPVNLDKIAEELAAQEIEMETKKLQWQSMKKEADDLSRKNKLINLEECVQNAKRYDNWAKDEGASMKPDREKIENYLYLSREAEKEAIALQIELGINTPTFVDAAPEETTSLRADNHVYSWLVSLVLAIMSIYTCYHFVMQYKTDIDLANAAIIDPSLKIGNPYDASSIQGIIYDNLVQFTDIPKLWLFLLILIPPIFFYSLPFVKTKVSPWEDWQQVSPDTRLWLLYAFSASIFLVSALYHLAGNGR